MKTAIYFIITCFISTGAFFGALNAKNPFLEFAIAFGMWVWFLWGYNRRSKKEGESRKRERLLDEYLKQQLRNRHR